MSGRFVRLKPRAGADIAFTIDGRPATAKAGDTLLTAILMNAPALRAFEFGEGARAGFCLMGACQDCWVTLGSGERRRACTEHVTDGLAVVTGTAHG